MAFELRCNLFQVKSSEPGLRMDPAVLGAWFDGTRMMMRALLGGQVELVDGNRPFAVTVEYKDPLPRGQEHALHRSMQAAQPVATLRATPGHGPINVYFIAAFAPGRNEWSGKWETCLGYGDFPFIIVSETATGWTAEYNRLVLLHEFGHLLLGRGHEDSLPDNLMNPGGREVTPRQRHRMIENARRIARGHRPLYPLRNTPFGNFMLNLVPGDRR